MTLLLEQYAGRDRQRSAGSYDRPGYYEFMDLRKVRTKGRLRLGRGHLVAQIHRLGLFSLYSFATLPGIFGKAQQVLGVWQ